MKLIIVEDEEIIAEILKASFKDYDFQFFYDATTASEVMAKQKFDLLITDISMPGYGGGERLLMEADSKGIHCVVYTSANHIHEPFYRSVGASEVFYKNQAVKLLTDYVDQFASGIKQSAS